MVRLLLGVSRHLGPHVGYRWNRLDPGIRASRPELARARRKKLYMVAKLKLNMVANLKA